MKTNNKQILCLIASLTLVLLLLSAGPVFAQPTVEWGTYVGGSEFKMDEGRDIAVDSSGNVYMTGNTESSGWVSGGWDTSLDGDSDSFVVKLSTDGAHVWSTYLGGAYVDYSYGIEVDSGGNVYVTGQTVSPSWVSGGWDTTFNGGLESFVVKLNTSGAHQWSSYIGGTGNDAGQGIALDSSANVYVTGVTNSSGWVSDGWDTSSNGLKDGFVVKLDTDGVYQWSSYLGGAGNDEGFGIASDSSGNTYTTGRTWSSGWVSDGWDTTFDGTVDSFVVKLDTDGVHQWSTYIGGTGIEEGHVRPVVYATATAM